MRTGIKALVASGSLVLSALTLIGVWPTTSPLEALIVFGVMFIATFGIFISIILIIDNYQKLLRNLKRRGLSDKYHHPEQN